MFGYIACIAIGATARLFLALLIAGGDGHD